MAKTLTKSAQEKAKQIARLKRAVKRAEKAGYIFDKSPIPERARASTLAKITSADIRKQSYRLTETGEKEYYSPFKARQQAVQKAKQTIAQKRLQPEYNEYYIAQHKYASQKAKQSTLNKKADVAKKTYQDVYHKYSAEADRKARENAERGMRGIATLEDTLIRAAGKKRQKAQNKAARQQRETDKAYTEYLRKKRELNDLRKLQEKSNQVIMDEDFYDDYDSDYVYDQYTSSHSTTFQWDTYVRGKLDSDAYKQIDNWVYNSETGEPMAFYDKNKDEYVVLLGSKETNNIRPINYDEIDPKEFLKIDPRTGEALGSTAEQVWNDKFIDEKLVSGEYEMTETGIVLDEHGEPVAIPEIDRKGKVHYEPYVQPPTFDEIASGNIDDYISTLSPNMQGVMNEAKRTAISEQGEDNFYSNVQDHYDELPYAFEEVIRYDSYTHLLTNFYHSLELVLGRDLTESERQSAEQAVNDDRDKRTRNKRISKSSSKSRSKRKSRKS